MEAFINKMRRLKGIRKMILIEEAWKAIASANMADYIKYLYKTVRKYFGEAIVVTQEVDDIIQSPIVKESIINNSDCKILLDQRKYMTKFDGIQAMLGLSGKGKKPDTLHQSEQRPEPTLQGGMDRAGRYAECRLCHRSEHGGIPHLYHGGNREGGGAEQGSTAWWRYRNSYPSACQ